MKPPVPHKEIFKKSSTPVEILLFLILAAMAFESAFAAPMPDLSPEAGMVLQKAYGLMEKKEVSRAIDVLRAFREQGLKNASAAGSETQGGVHYLIDFTLGNCYLTANQPEKACPLYESALKKNPRFYPAWINLAKCRYDRKQYENAGDAFLKGYEAQDSKKPDILYYAAVSFAAAGRQQRAADVFERLSTHHPEAMTLEWKETAVQAFLSAGQPEKALSAMEDLALKTSGEKRRQYQETLFYHYLNLKMDRQAVAFANRLIKEYPLDPKWWKVLAHLHLSANRYSESLIAMTVYGLMTPLTDQEKKLMAELSSAAGIPIQAARFYEAMLTEKIDSDILIQAVEAYLQSNRFEEALSWTEKGLRHVRDGSLLMLKGNILYAMKAYREAADVFGSIPEGKTSGQAALMMGYAAWNAGDLQKARLAFEKASGYPEQKKTAARLLDQLADAIPTKKSG